MVAMGVLSAVSVAEIKARGSIKDADVLKLRRSYDDDSRISAEEANTIFTLNDACPVQDPAWADCFVETITDYVVEQIEPQGYLTAENTAWLMARIACNGRVETKTGLELIVNVLDKARWAPQSLARFALEQVKVAVLDASGPLRSGQALPPGLVTEGDVDLLRRILSAFGCDGNLPLTQPEAEVLFDIDEGTAAADNHRSWRDLFVKAIAGAMMAASGRTVPPRAIQLARAGLHCGKRAPTGPGSGRGAAKRWIGGYGEQTEEERAIHRLTQQKIAIVTHETVTLAAAQWLASRIAREGRMTPNQRALITSLKGDGPRMHPSLRALIERAAPAP
jgi:hypothetical protein